MCQCSPLIGTTLSFSPRLTPWYISCVFTQFPFYWRNKVPPGTKLNFFSPCIPPQSTLLPHCPWLCLLFWPQAPVPVTQVWASWATFLISLDILHLLLSGHRWTIMSWLWPLLSCNPGSQCWVYGTKSRLSHIISPDPMAQQFPVPHLCIYTQFFLTFLRRVVSLAVTGLSFQLSYAGFHFTCFMWTLGIMIFPTSLHLDEAISNYRL